MSHTLFDDVNKGCSLSISESGNERYRVDLEEYGVTTSACFIQSELTEFLEDFLDKIHKRQ